MTGAAVDRRSARSCGKTIDKNVIDWLGEAMLEINDFKCVTSRDYQDDGAVDNVAGDAHFCRKDRKLWPCQDGTNKWTTRAKLTVGHVLGRGATAEATAWFPWDD